MINPVRFCWKPLLLFPLLAATVSAQPWSERLGFPAGRKVVILEAREMGVAWEFSEAAKQLLDSGHVSSAGAVVPAPWFNEVANWRADHRDVDLGVSIAITNPYETVSWHLLTSDVGPTSLVNADGYPWKSAVQVATSVHPNDVKTELDAQITRARQAGVNPTHISGYYGSLYSRVDLAEVLLGASRKYWLPTPVIELTPELIQRFRQEGFPVDEEMIQLIGNYPLPKLDDLRMSPNGTSYEDKRDRFCDLLAALKPGLTLLIFRPAVDSKGLRMLTPDWQQRVWDADVLRDGKVTEVMKAQDVIVTNWQEIMLRFEGKPLAVETILEGPAEEALEAFDNQLESPLDGPEVDPVSGLEIQ